MYTLCCFVKKLVLSWFTPFCREFCFVAIYALLCGEKLCQRLGMWRKSDKYQVCSRIPILLSRMCFGFRILSLIHLATLTIPIQNQKCLENAKKRKRGHTISIRQGAECDQRSGRLHRGLKTVVLVGRK